MSRGKSDKSASETPELEPVLDTDYPNPEELPKSDRLQWLENDLRATMRLVERDQNSKSDTLKAIGRWTTVIASLRK